MTRRQSLVPAASAAIVPPVSEDLWGGAFRPMWGLTDRPIFGQGGRCDVEPGNRASSLCRASHQVRRCSRNANAEK